jgi:membrane protease YdiL (CAAX protease family)
MDTSLGRSLLKSTRRLPLLVCVGLAVVTADFFFHWQLRSADNAFQFSLETYGKSWHDSLTGIAPYEETSKSYERAVQAEKAMREAWHRAAVARISLAVAMLAGYLILAKGDRRSLGLVLIPVQGCKYWAGIGLCVAILCAIGVLILTWLWVAIGLQIDVSFDSVLDMCLWGPLQEEIIYRLGICIPIAALWGPRAAIVCSGILFGLLHVLYGNANPINLLAGFFLAWTFLKSGSLVVPLLIHALGNVLFIYLAVRFLGAVAYW